MVFVYLEGFTFRLLVRCICDLIVLNVSIDIDRIARTLSLSLQCLRQVRKIAPEYYMHRPYYTSWVKVLCDFVLRPDVGLTSKVRRRIVQKSEKAYLTALDEKIDDDSGK